MASRYWRSAVGSQPAHEYVSDVDREAVLSQLSGIGWAIASDWLALHVGWDQVSLHLIKHVGLSASRLDALVEDGAILNVHQIRKEIAAYTPPMTHSRRKSTKPARSSCCRTNL